METMEDVLKGSSVDSATSSTACVGTAGGVDGDVEVAEVAEALRMGSGVIFGSGEGRIVRIDERVGIGVSVGCWGCDRITVVLYSEKVEGGSFL